MFKHLKQSRRRAIYPKRKLVHYATEKRIPLDNTKDSAKKEQAYQASESRKGRRRK